MIRELSILSLNANGMRDQPGRLHLFSWLRLSNAHIILLQDTRWTSADSALWSSQWGLPAIWSEHNAILSTSPSLSLTSLLSPVPRILLAQVSYPHWSAPLVCGSIYIPAASGARSDFLYSLPPSIPHDIAFLGGDCNIVANPSLDHLPAPPPSLSSPPSHWRDLADTLLQWGLSDLLRLQSPSSTQFTHSQNCPTGFVKTRIDYIFSPPSQTPLFSPLQAMRCPFSDHASLHTTLTISSALPHGSGTWRLNTSLLLYQDFKEAIKASWDEIRASPSSLPQDTWERAKSSFQAIAIFLSQSRSRQSLQQFHSAMEQIDQLDTALTSASALQRPHLLATRAQLQDALYQRASRVFQGMRTRTRTRWFEQGERSSSYFHRLIAGRRASSRLKGLKNAEGVVASSMEEITGICSGFYTNLYSAHPSDDSSSTRLLDDSLPSIPPATSAALDCAITVSEVEDAIAASATGSAPGADGLPFEFYKQFSPLLSPFLAELFNASLVSGTLPRSSSRSLLTLIFKKKGSEDDLKNWRPIALLNCDRKLLSKIIASRIQSVAKDLIHPSQTGFVQGRRIQDNTMAIYQILDYYRHSPSPGTLVFLDQEKAYDRVNWDYLLACLKKFGFGPRLSQAIMALHSGLNTSITANGFIGIPFRTAQGLPQGDPLSPILYDLVLEPFLAFLRRSLSGLPIPYLPFQVGAFADDLVVGISSPQDHDYLLEGIELHQKACNARLNLGKSETLFLSDSPSSPILGTMLPRDAIFTHLGIPFHPQSLPFPPSYYASLLDNLRATVAAWQPRKLSLQGKVLIINSRLLSKLWYLAYFVSFSPSFFADLQKIISAYLWDSRHPQIAANTLFTPRSRGGLGLIHPPSQCLATKGWWFHKLSLPSAPSWAPLAIFLLRERYLPAGWSSNIFLTSFRPSLIRHKGLWRDIYLAWKALHPEDMVRPADGLSSDDPLDAPLDLAFSSLMLASVPTTKYTIGTGSSFLVGRKFPLLTPPQWEVLLPPPPPGQPSPWWKVWKSLPPILKLVPTPHYILWWRILLSNLMTANRTSHYIPDLSPLCHHCALVSETPRHLFFECSKTISLWAEVEKAVPLVPMPLAADPSCPRLAAYVLLPSGSPRPSAPQVTITSFALWTIYTAHWRKVFDDIAIHPVGLRETFHSNLAAHFLVLERQAQQQGPNILSSFREEWNIPPFCKCDALGLSFLQPP
jgi:Reverse transcriptase (RNA-dependent DNA polymerase)/zinc-binding in reverse transcriptase